MGALQISVILDARWQQLGGVTEPVHQYQIFSFSAPVKGYRQLTSLLLVCKSMKLTYAGAYLS
jgi:hypothetical protein